MSDPKRVAIIDLGSNTSKLILMTYEPGRSYHQLDELRQVVRLAEGMADSDVMRAAAIERGLEALSTFSAYCEAAGVSEIRATATSAVRAAENGESFIEMIEERVGFVPKIITGEEEAYYELVSVANSLPYKDAYIIDIGGGSGELSFMKDRRFEWGKSWDFGALRMSERFMTSDPPKKKQVKALIEHVDELLGDDLDDDFAEDVPLIGLGGTIRNLAKIHKKMVDYPLDLLNGYFLPKEGLEDVVETLLEQTVEEKRDLSGLKTDRADIITAGGIVTLELLKRSGAPGIVIGSQGLREGVFYGYLLDEDEPFLEDVRDFSVRNLMRRYYDNEAHNEHVKTLALSLFDQLETLHNYGEGERELLGAAALLARHRHGDNLQRPSQARLLPAARERVARFQPPRASVIIALLVRYHRQGSPDDEGLGDVLEDDDMNLVDKLAGILRLAEYLERSKAQRVTEVVCHVSDNYVQINAQATQDISVELRETNLRKDLFAEAFGVEVEVTQL